MIALVIGASLESIYAITNAKKMKLEVYAFDGDCDAPGLKIADKGFVTDIRNPKNIIDILSFEKIIPDIVLPVPIGRYLVSGASINDYYKLKGVSEKIADICTDKYLFHKILNDAGLRDATCKLIKSETKLENICDISLRYPVIIKPRYGSGSRGVTVACSYIELKRELIERIENTETQTLNEDYIVEDMIEGKEYGLDAVIENGVFKLVLLRGKILTEPPSRQCVGYYSIVPDEEKNIKLIQQVNDYMNKIVQRMNIDNTILHGDLIIKGDSIFVIEISARPSGHRLHNLFTPLVTGVDMIKEYIKYAIPMEMDYSFVPRDTKHLMIRYFDFEDCYVSNMPDEKMLLDKYPIVKYECNIKNEKMCKVNDGHSIMNRGYFIVSGDTTENMIDTCKCVLDEFALKKCMP